MTRFKGEIAFEGLATSDGRIVTAGTLTWDTPIEIPVFLLEQTVTQSHGAARPVGVLDELWRDEFTIRAVGVLYELDDVFAELGVDRLPCGVDLDLTEIDADSIAPMAILKGRIRGLTLYAPSSHAVPAWPNAHVTLEAD